jgi:hypothetical protein
MLGAIRYRRAAARMLAAAAAAAALFAWPSLTAPAQAAPGSAGSGTVVVQHLPGGHGIPGPALRRTRQHTVQAAPEPLTALAPAASGARPHRRGADTGVHRAGPSTRHVSALRIRAPPLAR